MKTTTHTKKTFLIELSESELQTIAMTILAAGDDGCPISGAAAEVVELAVTHGLGRDF